MQETAAEGRQVTATRRVLARHPGLLGALALGIVVRVLLGAAIYAHAGTSQAFTVPDTQSYVRSAESMLEHGRFGIDEPELSRTPGYPLLLIPGLAAGHMEAVTLALQVLLSAVTAILVFALAIEIGGDRRVAGWAAALYAVEPLSMYYTTVLCTETLFAALFAGLMLALARCGRTTSIWWAVAAAVLLSCACYVRPVGVPLVAAITLLLVARCWQGRRARWSPLAVALAFPAVCVATMLPWVARNRAVAGYPGFSAIADQTLYFYEGAAVLARTQNEDFERTQARMGWTDSQVYFSHHPDQRNWTPAQRYLYRGREGARIIRNAPFTWLQVRLMGLASETLSPGALDVLHACGAYHPSVAPKSGAGGAVRALRRLGDRGIVALVMLVLCQALDLTFLGLAIVGLHRLRTKGWSLALPGGAAAALWLLSGGAAAYSRFRQPLTPLMCVLAAYALSAFVVWFRGRTRLEGALGAPRETVAPARPS